MNNSQKIATPQAIIILGMHRSGTSCLAGCLQEAGLYLGEVNTSAPHNAKGNRESRTVTDLQDDILHFNGGAWDDPPKNVIWSAEHRAQCDTIIGSYPSDRIWGFKDPRTLLTLEGWLEALPTARLVGTFRHPLAVVASLQARNGYSIEKSLMLWEVYNRRLLDTQRRFGFPLLCFDWSPERYQQQLYKVVAQLELTVPESGFSFFESALRHNWERESNERPLPPSVDTLYRTLYELASSPQSRSWLGNWVDKINNLIRPTQISTDSALTRQTVHLSIIVVIYNMRREAPRTLYSLTPTYQIGVNGADYEVIVVENGSTEPLNPEEVKAFGTNYHYISIEQASPSPASAINHGVRLSKAPFVGIMIDGARLVTPGAIALAMQCLGHFDRAVVGTVGFHLGPDLQMKSIGQGYNQVIEDEWLTRIDWRNQGYRLFEIGALAGSSPTGWLGTLQESNLLFLRRSLFDELKGFDERFESPGGGFVNLDFYCRACDLPNSILITLLGEATFHQTHGGVTTNQPIAELPRCLQIYGEEYKHIRGFYHTPPKRPPVLFGHPRSEIIPWLHQGCKVEMRTQAQTHLVNRFQEAASNPIPPFAGTEQSTPQNPTLEPGDSHYRAYVGRVENYDVIAALQFNLLTLLGLREQHRLLDLGCGSLRGGRLFIPYLRVGNYFGIEPNAWLIEEAITHEVGSELIALKQPRFSHNDDFRLDLFEVCFDFILAQSIFSHAGPTQIRQALASARSVLEPSGLLVATFGERTEEEIQDMWVYPGLNFYHWSTIASLCSEVGLHCCKLDWPHPQQTWFAAACNSGRLEAIADSGVDFLPDTLVLTDMRLRERDAGRAPTFYRVWNKRDQGQQE